MPRHQKKLNVCVCVCVCVCWCSLSYINRTFEFLHQSLERPLTKWSGPELTMGQWVMGQWVNKSEWVTWVMDQYL